MIINDVCFPRTCLWSTSVRHRMIYIHGSHNMTDFIRNVEYQDIRFDYISICTIPNQFSSDNFGSACNARCGLMVSTSPHFEIPSNQIFAWGQNFAQLQFMRIERSEIRAFINLVCAIIGYDQIPNTIRFKSLKAGFVYNLIQ